MESDFTAQCSLVMAKTKVAPLKKKTITRLELSAAVLLSQLVDRCREILDMQDVATHLWSDSSVTLTWIAGRPSRWKEYVANRVQLIHDLMPNARWHHVPGEENPADIASRGSTPEQLLRNPSWWWGPSWLAEHSTSWPISDPQLPASVNLEERSPVVSFVVKKIATWDLAGRYSSLNRLLRVTAYVLRAATRFRRPRENGFPKNLEPEGLEKALVFWVKHIQAVHFPDEVDILQRGEVLPRSSPLLRLTPFFDKDGLVRVGGRLNNADVEYDFKHPYILPRNSPLSNLLINDIHQRTLHVEEFSSPSPPSDRSF